MSAKNLIFIAAFAAATVFSASAKAEENPKARPEAEVVSGNARFTVLTDRLIRMEWSADGKFEDRATLGIINRNLAVPGFKVSKTPDKTVIRTSAVTLTYTGDGRFTEDNLSVSFRLDGKTVVWKPGTAATGNLKGTIRTLDRIIDRKDQSTLRWYHQKRGSQERRLEDGILSRDGWAVVDESDRHILEKNSTDWGEWVEERPEGDRQDLYIFAYGHDYKAALSDFTKVAGRIPMPPKYTFGYWWSRYWIYTDDELLQIASELREHKVPADVFIIDMDWHLTWKPLKKRKGKDEFGQDRGWTGYTWNHDLIENPTGLLYDIHSLGFKTSLNLHPASGIRQYEDCYDTFVRDYVSRTDDYDGPKGYVYGKEPYTFAGNTESFAREGYPAPVPYRMDQVEWADAYFNSVIHPLEKQGVDFWWLDWQQWPQSKYVKGLSNTFWINWCFFNDKLRRSASLGKDADRPFIYHRWGGLGSHRYQLGFSGDIFDEWSSLELLPYFTATASNVGYGYWGHDIGGHQQVAGHDTDPEIYTRWLQYGVFTPIFKTHSTESKYLERKIWAYPTHYEYMKEAIELRYALSPYIYTASRQAYDTGICICRPLYYDYPEEQKAYELDQEFLFGDYILATVLCQPLDPATGKTERKMWFPKGGDWYDMALHCLHKGGCEKTLHYAIDENPWYVKAGSVITLAGEGIQNLQNADNRLRLLIVPGGPSVSSCVLYEDDGVSQAYDTDFATTKITRRGNGSSVSIEIAAREGFYKGMPETRNITLILEGWKKAPSAVLVNGRKVEAGCSADGCSVTITIGELPADKTAKIVVRKQCIPAAEMSAGSEKICNP